MGSGKSIPQGAEHDHYAKTFALGNQRHRAIRPDPLFYVRLFEAKFNLGMQVASHDSFLVLKHPPVMAFIQI